MKNKKQKQKTSTNYFEDFTVGNEWSEKKEKFMTMTKELCAMGSRVFHQSICMVEVVLC
jgi:hypothetical protein